MSMQSQMLPIPMHEVAGVVASIQPIKFYVKYVEVTEQQPTGEVGKDGKPVMKTVDVLKADEWVVWAKKGVSIPFTSEQKISRIKKAAAKATPEEPDHEGAAMWRAIKPFYDNWKAGGTQEVINGTPLAIWRGVTQDVVEALKPFKIYSVEDLSIASDAVLQRVPDPNIMKYRAMAKKFLDTKDIAIAVRDSETSKAENESLRAEMAELKKMLADTMKGKREAEEELDEATPAPARKKRGKESAGATA